MKSKSVLNTDCLKLEYPEIYARYLIQSADSIVLIGRKDNGYRNPALSTVAPLYEGVRTYGGSGGSRMSDMNRRAEYVTFVSSWKHCRQWRGEF